MPTRRQISRVRAIIYERGRMRRLHVQLSSIDALMNTSTFPPLDSNDARIIAGSGPNWVAENGAIIQSVLEAADRCDVIARQMLSIRSALADVNIPGDDRRRLRAGYAAQAAAWKARGAVWREPGQPDVDAAAARIAGHESEAARHFRAVRRYLKQLDPRDYA